MHKIAILALHGTVAADLAVPCEVFSRVRAPGVRAPYEVRVCGQARNVRGGAHFDLRVPWRLKHAADAHTVVVPGLAQPTQPVDDAVLRTLRDAAARGARIASICSGAFVLAAAGLLNGRRATTHWMAADALARLYPEVEVDPNVLYVDNGQVLTSAGAAAGMDLCLHMIRRDYGEAVAADAARLSVTPLERSGGQALFRVHEPPASADTLEPLLSWMEQHLQQPLALADLARRAATSTRTLSRRFMAQTGTTPARWVLGARVRRAQHLLETTALPVERIATEAGFASATTLRERFTHMVGTSPQRYRQAFLARRRQPGA